MALSLPLSSTTEDRSWLCTLAESWEVRLFCMNCDRFQNCLKGRRLILFFSSFTWMTGCRQPSTDLGGFFMESFPGSKVHCPFLALPSACIPTCFKWAMQPKIGVAEKLPDINEVFSLSCLERSKCEGSSLFSWDQMCLVGLQGYLRSENQQESECSKDQRSDLSYSLWRSNNITIKKWRVFSLQPTNF